jgi:hypothetical protein
MVECLNIGKAISEVLFFFYKRGFHYAT